MPGWASSYSQSVADLIKVSQSLVAVLDKLPLGASAGPSTSQDVPSDPASGSRKRPRQDLQAESSPRPTSPHSPQQSPSRASSPESGEALSESEGVLELDSDQDANMKVTVQNLIAAIHHTFDIADAPAKSSDQEVSSRRAETPSRVFPFHSEFGKIFTKEREDPTRRFQRGKRLGVLYPFAKELTDNWAASRSVDPPVSRLSNNTVLPLSGVASLKDSNDRIIESLAKSAFEAASAAVCPVFVSSWAAKAISTWADDLRQGILDKARPEHLADLANQISHAGDYLLSASLDAASCAVQASSNIVAIRRTIWLKAWQADLSSKKSLTNLPFQGVRLFGSQLDQIIKDATGGTSSLLPSKPRRPPPRRQFRPCRTFRRFNTAENPSNQQRPQARQERKKVSFRPTPSWRSHSSQGRPSRSRSGRSTSA
ncbi:uncharacterized protein [Dendrobates tinctorius]|uniref:uncharacterized protein n=1 Tax=Dendrobates tinctorius TaxID=92724 RepID=UPI003CCA3E6A